MKKWYPIICLCVGMIAGMFLHTVSNNLIELIIAFAIGGIVAILTDNIYGPL